MAEGAAHNLPGPDSIRDAARPAPPNSMASNDARSQPYAADPAHHCAFDRHRRHPAVAAQQELGLLPQRRPYPDPDHFADSAAGWVLEKTGGSNGGESGIR